ncbi:MAG TPA: hypothetical protein V6C58_14650 [Allocoleopsis sp.]
MNMLSINNHNIKKILKQLVSTNIRFCPPSEMKDSHKEKKTSFAIFAFLVSAAQLLTPVLLSEKVLADFVRPELLAQAQSEVGCPQCNANRSFPRLSGIYRGVNKWGVLRITKFNYRGNSSTFSGDDNNENPYFKHFTTGALVSANVQESIWNIRVRRTNTSNACTTIMRGTLTLKRNDTMRVVITNTDGNCDLGTNFSEFGDLRKN